MSDIEIHKGLMGVYVDTSKVSKVVQETNSLTYRGYAVQDLAENCSFEEVAYLLWHGELPNKSELLDFLKLERSMRDLSDEAMTILRQFPASAHPMDTLRTVVSFLGVQDENWEDPSFDANVRKSIAMLSKIPTIIAADFRLRNGQEPIAPRDDLSLAENFFYMYFGKVPEAAVVKCFDTSLIFYAEHGFNASTFTGRAITSTLSDIYSSVTGAIGSLKGPLHGGANEAVMHTLLEIGSPEKAQAWIDDAMANKKLVMGFGHRVYKDGDSRVPYMTKVFHEVANLRDGQKWLEISKILEDTFVSKKGIHPNLDFPVGPAYYLMGFDIPVFTPIFVMSRITGWTAHIMEQLEDNKLMRPLNVYNGMEQREVKPLEQRAA